MYWGKDMQDIYISGTGIWTPPNTVSNKELVESFNNYVDMKKFEPIDWAQVNNTVYFTVNWEFIWKPTGKYVKCSANVRKVIKDGKIAEKYHMVNYNDIVNHDSSFDNLILCASPPEIVVAD